MWQIIGKETYISAQRPSYKMRKETVLGGATSVEISWHDLDGREVLLKDNVIFSSKVNQSIHCYGRLMEHGWGINGREHMLENGDLKVPLHLQNRSLTVQGRARVSRDEDENCLGDLGSAST